MVSKELQEHANEYKSFLTDNGYNHEVVGYLTQAVRTAISNENEVKYGLSLSAFGKEVIEAHIARQTDGGDVWALHEYLRQNGQQYEAIEDYFELLLIEAPILLDSFCLYIEKDRKRKECFYLPRRRTLKKVVDLLQKLEDDELDEIFIHMPARVGKSQIITMATAWHCARDDEHSNLYVTYKEGLGGAYIDGVMEIFLDPTYAFHDVFPNVGIARTDAKNHKVDLTRRKKYATLSGKGMDSGLNGEYDAYGWLILDDPLEGIQDVLNPDILRRKQIVLDNNVMSRKKENCKLIWNGTIWSLHDLFMDRVDFLENNPEAKGTRYEILKIPALDPETDESNFDYDFGVGFSTRYYRTMRAKFEENDDMAGWCAQCQQEPIERDGAVFDAAHMRFYNGVLPDEGLYRICAACDVALGGLDYLAFAVAYLYEDGSVYIDDVIFDNSDKKVTKPKVVDMIVSHNVGSAYFEANQGGEGYKDEIDAMLREKGVKINLHSEYAPSSKRKEQRIWDKSPSIREFYFRDAGYRSKEYRLFMTNLFSFTVNGKNKHEDAADCLASLAYFIEGTWERKVARIMPSLF